MNGSDEFSRLLNDNFSAYKELSADQISEFYAHWSLLTRWNKALNLTRVTSLEESVVRHYCESLFLTIHLPDLPMSVLDVGSGAGFPGIPFAIMRPDCEVTLSESHQRKAVFLREATRHLRNVRVEARRAESLTAEAFDWVVSRAVRPDDVIRFARHSLGLLIGQEDAVRVQSQPGFEWRPLIPLPWGQRRCLLIGTRT
jgi:16S rRNA (guanine527-N7)-methyltransferase